MGTYAESADPVQTPQNVASDQGQYCLLTGISLKIQLKWKHSPKTSKTRNRPIQIIKMDKSTSLSKSVYLVNFRKTSYVSVSFYCSLGRPSNNVTNAKDLIKDNLSIHAVGVGNIEYRMYKTTQQHSYNSARL